MIRINRRSYLILLGFVCIASRLLTSINYIEDPDSLRFALGVIDFDLSLLQPHFPGYPVYIAVVKLFYFLLGYYHVAFAITGGISIFLLVLAAEKLQGHFYPRSSNYFISILVFLSPIFWLMSNRFMPDLLGLAVLAWCLVFYVEERNRAYAGTCFFFLAGLLAGIRLSYLPFLLVPFAYSFIWNGSRLKKAAAGLAGIGIWLAPMIIDTGLHDLVAAGRMQAEGHFNDWGGTVITEPDTTSRLVAFIRGIWADGLGMYWQERSVLTVFSSVIFLLIILIYISRKPRSLPFWLLLSAAVYAAWALLWQNILFNPRHLMPLVLVLLFIVADALFIVKQKYLAYMFVSVFCVTSVYLAWQHKTPSAMYFTAQWLKHNTKSSDKVISTEVVNFYLTKLGVKASMMDIRTYSSAGVPPGRKIFVGNIQLDQSADTSLYFWHNPYVNRIWPEVKITVTE